MGFGGNSMTLGNKARIQTQKHRKAYELLQEKCEELTVAYVKVNIVIYFLISAFP